MIQARPISPSLDLCCLHAPRRTPQGIAGMAFNFSKIELSHHPRPRKLPRRDDAIRIAKDTTRT